MGKISKYSNVYDKNGNLLRHVNDDGVLKSMSMTELEELIDRLAEDKDENGNIKNPQALNNVNQIYFMESQKPKNRDILKKRFEELKKTRHTEVADNEQVIQKLNETMEQLKNDAIKEGLVDEKEQERPSDDPEYSMDKYVEFEEIPAAA